MPSGPISLVFANYGWAYLRGVAILSFALVFPLIVLGTIATFFVGVNVGDDAWRAIWLGIAAVELTLLALAAIQWKRAWVLTRDHPNRRRLAGVSLVGATVFLGAVAVFIMLNIGNTCEC